LTSAASGRYEEGMAAKTVKRPQVRRVDVRRRRTPAGRKVRTVSGKPRVARERGAVEGSDFAEALAGHFGGGASMMELSSGGEFFSGGGQRSWLEEARY